MISSPFIKRICSLFTWFTAWLSKKCCQFIILFRLTLIKRMTDWYVLEMQGHLPNIFLFHSKRKWITKLSLWLFCPVDKDEMDSSKDRGHHPTHFSQRLDSRWIIFICSIRDEWNINNDRYDHLSCDYHQVEQSGKIILAVFCSLSSIHHYHILFHCDFLHYLKINIRKITLEGKKKVKLFQNVFLFIAWMEVCVDNSWSELLCDFTDFVIVLLFRWVKKILVIPQACLKTVLLFSDNSFVSFQILSLIMMVSNTLCNLK